MMSFVSVFPFILWNSESEVLNCLLYYLTEHFALWIPKVLKALYLFSIRIVLEYICLKLIEFETIVVDCLVYIFECFLSTKCCEPLKAVKNPLGGSPEIYLHMKKRSKQSTHKTIDIQQNMLDTSNIFTERINFNQLMCFVAQHHHFLIYEANNL